PLFGRARCRAHRMVLAGNSAVAVASALRRGHPGWCCVGFGARQTFAVITALGQSFGAVLSRKAYGVARQTGENIDGITAAYQRILGGLLVALLCYSAFKKFRQGGFALPSRNEAPPQSE